MSWLLRWFLAELCTDRCGHSVANFGYAMKDVEGLMQFWTSCWPCGRDTLKDVENQMVRSDLQNRTTSPLVLEAF